MESTTDKDQKDETPSPTSASDVYLREFGAKLLRSTAVSFIAVNLAHNLIERNYTEAILSGMAIVAISYVSGNFQADLKSRLTTNESNPGDIPTNNKLE